MQGESAELQTRLMQNLYDHNKRGAIFNILTSAYVLLFLFFSLPSSKGLLLWFSILTATNIVRLILARKAEQWQDPAIMHKAFPVFAFIIFVTGILWGTIYPMYFHQMTDFQRLLTTLIMYGGITVAILTFGSSKACYYLFSAPIVIPVLIYNLSEQSVDYYFFNLGLIIYLLFVVYLHHTQHQRIKGNLDLVMKQEVLIKNLRRMNEKLSLASIMDSLTKLYNRGHFSDRLQRDWSRCKRARLPIALLIVDIDYFKEYNDTYGHLKGDECLQEVANILKEVVTRETDLAARFGGDELALILYNTDADGATTIGKRIIDALHSRKIEHSKSPKKIVTVSIGLAVHIPEHDEDMERLLIQADRALYQVKNSGRDGLVSYSNT